jgi:hypothetical protein
MTTRAITLNPRGGSCECPPVTTAWGRTLRPYRVHALVLAYLPLLVVVDGLLAGRGQAALGLLTLAVLLTCLRAVPRPQRLLVWLCVPIATLFEILGSLVWGGYTYRLENIPLYVPPGHALVFLFGLTAAALPVVLRHEAVYVRVVLCLATAWVVAGLTVLPLLTHRVDVQGAACLPLLAWCLLRSGRGALFASIWVVTAALELAGTWSGAWVWAAEAPWSQLPSANPPAAIAAGYAIIDGTVAIVAGALLRRRSRARQEPDTQPAIA